MKILVAVKQVIDPYVKIRVKTDFTGVEKQNVKLSMNPFDEIAVEEAVRLREKKLADEIIVVTIGAQISQEVLRHALALGADRAIHIPTENNFCSLSIAKILHKIALNVLPDLILMGKQAIDDDNNQTAQMLAALLHWPQATFVSKIEISDDTLQAEREVDRGLEILKMKLPAVLSTDLRLNQPRYASLPNIMRAKSKPIEKIEIDSLELTLREHIRVLKIDFPKPRSAGIIVDSVATLVDKLKHEAKVLE